MNPCHSRFHVSSIDKTAENGMANWWVAIAEFMLGHRGRSALPYAPFLNPAKRVPHLPSTLRLPASLRIALRKPLCALGVLGENRLSNLLYRL
jgi:hypothetical protein